jgi:hypothetical protein
MGTEGYCRLLCFGGRAVVIFRIDSEDGSSTFPPITSKNIYHAIRSYVPEESNLWVLHWLYVNIYSDINYLIPMRISSLFSKCLQDCTAVFSDVTLCLLLHCFGESCWLHLLGGILSRGGENNQRGMTRSGAKSEPMGAPPKHCYPLTNLHGLTSQKSDDHGHRCENLNSQINTFISV